ncbi:MAG: LysR family transcriptional regulator [Solirubrobacterales bacterium]
MDIRQLKYFIAIAEEEQITSAANKLNISQPPLSQQLKQLEDELGVKLFERGSRKIQLTDAGKLLKSKAEKILELTEEAYKELKDFNKGLTGTISIGTVSSSGTLFNPERIQNFNKNYPDINFEIWEGNTYKILEFLNRGLIEIGIVRTPFNIENFNSILLEREPMIAVYSEEKCKDTYIINDFIDKPLIIYRRFERIIGDVFNKADIEPRVICKTDDARTALLWAASGVGTALVPKSAFSLVQNSSLNYSIVNEPALETELAAIWMENRYLSTAAKHFLELFKSY